MTDQTDSLSQSGVAGLKLHSRACRACHGTIAKLKFSTTLCHESTQHRNAHTGALRISIVAMAHPDATEAPQSAPASKPDSNGVPSPPSRIGPHPGFISSSNQYSSEIKVRRMLKDNGCDPAREDNYRLQGVQLIDNVRESLQL